MKKINIFCFGFGQVAKNFIEKINLENFDIKLSTTSREKTSEKKFNNITYTNYYFDGNEYDHKIIEIIENTDYILVSIPPKNGIDLVLNNFSEIIKKSNFKWITYLSATSVYGNHNSDWVNEDSSNKPSSNNGIDRLSAEKLWMSLYTDIKKPVQIFRLSGIYSYKNNILLKLKLGNAKIINKKDHFFSRIHLEDISNILFKSLSIFKPGEIYNISDDKPAPANEVTLYGVKLLNIEEPKSINIEDIENQMLKNFYKDSKKVSNKKMKEFFNYSLKFPTYIEGLNYIRNNFF